ncbi:monovalent cation/H+ antiporter complex subunit F [Leucobacter sp. W1478]|uniref:monovalent cation/H+ antiporter complex subunit F n=1 Tax=Leucobacter sp. W1478 TaxID=3439065 RepID=UPI003F2E1D3B
MTVLFSIAVAFAVAGLTLTALFTVIRIVRGPTILDRMIASDVLLTTLILAVGTDMVLRNHVDGIPLMTAIAATAVLATIAVARYVKRRTRTTLPVGPGEVPND